MSVIEDFCAIYGPLVGLLCWGLLRGLYCVGAGIRWTGEAICVLCIRGINAVERWAA